MTAQICRESPGISYEQALTKLKNAHKRLKMAAVDKRRKQNQRGNEPQGTVTHAYAFRQNAFRPEQKQEKPTCPRCTKRHHGKCRTPDHLIGLECGTCGRKNSHRTRDCRQTQSRKREREGGWGRRDDRGKRSQRNERSPVRDTCQFCDKAGHTARQCRKLQGLMAERVSQDLDSFSFRKEEAEEDIDIVNRPALIGNGAQASLLKRQNKHDSRYLYNIRDCNVHMTGATGNKAEIRKMADAEIPVVTNGQKSTVQLKNALLQDNPQQELIAVNQLENEDTVYFQRHGLAKLVDLKTGKTVLEGVKNPDTKLYWLRTKKSYTLPQLKALGTRATRFAYPATTTPAPTPSDTPPPKAAKTAPTLHPFDTKPPKTPETESKQQQSAASRHNNGLLHLWHRRLGHIDEERVLRMHRLKLASGLKLPPRCTRAHSCHCSICLEAKHTRKKIKFFEDKPIFKVGECLHVDINIMTKTSWKKEKYLLLLTDQTSGYTFDHYLKDRSGLDRLRH